MPPANVLGIDIAKQVFHIVGLDDTSNIVLRKRLPRGALMPFIAQIPPVVIEMEACGGAHYWARRFREHGHCVKLMAPQVAALRAALHDGNAQPPERAAHSLKGALSAVAAIRA
jgi:transposase